MPRANTSILRYPYRSVCFYALLILLFVNLLQTVCALFFSGFIQFDDVEHLRAAYFVANREIPYRDFFEHHHPLLWYLLAPIVKILPHNTLFAIYIGRLVSLIVSMIGGYYVYKIEKKFLGNTFCALVCLNLYFWSVSDISASAMFNIKPDVYMRGCFIAGLYYLLCYFEQQKFKDLQICTLLFTLSFLFLQTAIFTIASLILPIGYFLYKNPSTYKDFIKASLVPLCIFALFIGVLLHSDIWDTYWQTNWVFNSVLAQLLQTASHTKHLLLIADVLVVAICAVGYYALSATFNIYVLSIFALFVLELIQRLFFNATHVYYLSALVLYSAMLAAPFICKAIAKHYLFLCAFIGISVLHMLANGILLMSHSPLCSEKYLQKTSGVTVTSNFYSPRLSYYWMYPLLEGVDDVLFQRLKDYDINHLYRKSNPEIIIISPGGTPKAAEYIIKSLSLNHEQQKILKRHVVDIKGIGNYIEIEKNIYQHSTEEE